MISVNDQGWNLLQQTTERLVTLGNRDSCTFVTVREEEGSSPGAVEWREVVHYHTWVLCDAPLEHTHGWPYLPVDQY